MLRLQFSKCVAGKGSYAIRGMSIPRLRTTTLTIRKPNLYRSLATVVPNEPPVLYPL